MCQEMKSKLTDLFKDAKLNCIIIKGSGNKAFCAGGDVKCIAMEKGPFVPGKPGTLRSDFFREEYELNYMLANAKAMRNSTNKPEKVYQVSIWNGVVMGGGAGISMHGAFRIATENSLFAMPETAIGIFPDVGASYVLSRLPSGIGHYLGMVGTRIKASDLIFSGLATHFIPSKNLMALEKALIEDKGEDVAGTLSKYCCAVPFEKGELEENRQAIERCFNHKKSVECIITALENENSEWSSKTLKIMANHSPTSLKLTHKQLILGRDLPLRGCFEMEFRMMQRAMMAHDFTEGIRSVLIDKDRSPKWDPPKLSQVKEIDHYFDPLSPYELQLFA